MACKQWLGIFGLFLAANASGVLSDVAADPVVPSACEVGDCDAGDGAALLQHAPALRVDQDDSMGEAEVEKDEIAKEIQGARVTEHSRARIIVHDDAEVVGEGKTYRWVITIPTDCSNQDLKKVAGSMPQRSKPKFTGDPDHGGLCVFVMEGTEDDVKRVVYSSRWPSAPIIETDIEWSVIPEVPEDGTDASDASLIGVDGMVSQPNPPSWGLDRVDDRTGLDNDYSPPNQGAGVRVYVADTGIRTTHDDFGGRAIPTLEVLSSSHKVCPAGDTTCALDRHGHGTHCAGTIGGSSFGVAKGASLHAVKVLSDSGWGSFSWFIDALDWVMTSGQKPYIFSASLGAQEVIASLEPAINKAVNAGLVVVVAAGNNNRDACRFSPAYVPEALTVAATEQGDSRAGYSNYGSCIDIFAPGSLIVSAGIGNDQSSNTFSGTSMACPHVAGAAALILSAEPALSVVEVREAMIDGSTKDIVFRQGGRSPNNFLYTNVAASR